jgi:hypothetical protein
MDTRSAAKDRTTLVRDCAATRGAGLPASCLPAQPQILNKKKSQCPPRLQFLFPRTTEFDPTRCNAGFRLIER